MEKYYHYCSRGLKQEILFASDEEFIAGMNRIAVCLANNIAMGRAIVIIAFCLMDNHFHFILFGREEDCDLFVANYKKLLLMWIAKHRDNSISEQVETGHWFIPQEKVADKIAYVLRNPVAAGLKVVPHGYRWSSAHLMFSDWRPEEYLPVSELSDRAIKRICNTNIRLPKDWLIIKDTVVWPGSYVDVEAAENFYRSTGSFMFVLNNSNVDKDAAEEMMAGAFSLPDSQVKMQAISMIARYFGKSQISSCSAEERGRVAILLKKELNCNNKQLARVLHLRLEDVQAALA